MDKFEKKRSYTQTNRVGLFKKVENYERIPALNAGICFYRYSAIFFFRKRKVSICVRERDMGGRKKKRVDDPGTKRMNGLSSPSTRRAVASSLSPPLFPNFLETEEKDLQKNEEKGQ